MSPPPPSPAADPASCPPLADLHAAADLPAPPAVLSTHFESCESCRRTFDEIVADNDLADELARAATRPEAQPIELPIGARVGHYTITGTLGIGGMGVVHRARQDNPDRPVALKLIKADYATPAVLRRFEHEAAALALLKHPGIAQVYEAGAAIVGGERGGIARPFIAMELVDGVRLDEFAAKSRPDRPTIVRLVAAIADAVDHAHRKGVIHRDLKPANILVEDHGLAAPAESGIQTLQPRILDFGVAKLTDNSGAIAATQTGIGGFVGTLAYAAPEQVAGDPAAIDARADVFALGLILYELLVGQRAYTLDGPLNTSIRMLSEARIPTPESRGTKIDPELQVVLDTALAADPARRYQSAAALADDLRRYLERRPLRARPDSTLYTLRRAVARHPYRAAAAAGFVVFAITAVAVALTLQVRATNAARLQAGVSSAFLDTLTSANQDSDDTGRLESIDELFDAFAQNIRSNLEDHPDEEAELLHKLGRAMLSHRKLDQAIGVLEEVVAHRRTQAGENPASLAAALHDLGRACYFRGLYEQSCAHLTEALALRERSLGNVDRDTVDSRYWLGVAYMGWRKFEPAEEHVRRALADEQAHRPGSPQVAEHLTSLAAIVRFRGDFDEALKIARQALAAIEDARGADHKHVAVALANIVANLNNLGRYEEAEPLIARSLAIREKWYGPDDPRVADTLVQTVSLKMRRAGFIGEPGGPAPEVQAELLADAADKAQRALTMRQQVHKGDHEQLAEVLSLLGQVRMRQQRYADALPALTAAMDMRSRIHGASNADVGRSESVLGECLLRAGRAADAEPLLRSGLEKVRAGYGEGHRFTLEATRRLESLGR